jgi:hypothetical protein
MKISDRFTDYGLIGGFFWLLQCLVWGVGIFPIVGWDHLLQGVCKDFTYLNPYIPFLAALLVLLRHNDG